MTTDWPEVFTFLYCEIKELTDKLHKSESNNIQYLERISVLEKRLFNQRRT